MSTSIVYEGDLVSKLPSQHGLFKNMHFWVGHRVPSRVRYIQMIQNNGGKIVPLEKRADYLISDHLKKHDCPPGSYSYKWIEDSCKEGVLKDPEEYLCVPAQRSAKQPSGSAVSVSVPVKSTRTKFTAEDDRILREWVAINERKGERVLGNEIYKALEAEYPHHTFQSWRDRWVKKLQYQPPLHEPRRTPSPPPTRRTAESSVHAPPKTPGSLGRRVPARGVATIEGRAKFTEEDDELLMQHMAEYIRHGKPTQGIKPFRELAHDFPQHTEQSWRSRWVQQLEPKWRKQIAREKLEREPEEVSEEEPEEGPEEEHEDTSETGQDTRMGIEKPHEVSIPQDRPRIHSSSRSANKASTAANNNLVGDKIKDRRDDDAEFQATSQASVQEPAEMAADSEQTFPDEPSMKEQFLRDYQAYLESKGHRLIPWLTIKGRTFDVWSLWSAVASQNMDPSERDWQQIAEELGFDWVQHETVHDEIRKCYEEYLAEFEEMWESFNADAESGSEDDEDDNDDEDGDEEAELSTEEPLPLLSIIPSRKRPFDAQHSLSDHAYPEPSPKRRKIDRGTEIPSTPDHKNRTSNQRSQDSNETPLGVRRSTKRAMDDRTEKNKSRNADPELPVFETQGNFHLESQYNITPSQQLHQESDAISLDLAGASPTPKARTGVANVGNTTPKRLIRNPFQEDSDDDAVGVTTTNHNNDTFAKVASTKAKRRSLPNSYAQKPLATIGASTSEAPRDRAGPSRPERVRPSRRLTSPKETPEDVIDRFCSLGYPREIVLQALRATTWRLGDAGQVMEILKRGEELPQRTRGVWTERDDDALKLVTSDERQLNDKEKRKRARAKERLEKKHGLELMELRRKYLWEVV
ncbi:TRF2-interacting telomeric protein/Rap1 C terminal domain-containing protein [Daldinia caldariorum]|uniref:TRF2-interacting telomeric protein/Rap1 C terminal domain-containing protein n=1 Tax=Daldinia caldariorum TaxID=326644 RepID=UPI002008CB20|nr:TRF2-interacting telomeric protein/Rap1 C terminal domain-containing protein [Daldinia caldariorum]KAI1473189.1 TRF2-interacting telomeric protein/Rap1 C terminal domain-containing protein [Daldinia caldariorum]